MFGRGGEELLACARAGVPCEVVPRITSAVAAPAAAGIPVTHRGIARSFAVVTASTAGTAHAPDAVDLGRVATAVNTLVLLMAAGKLETTCGALVVGAVVSIPAEAAALAAPLPELDLRSITRRGTDRGSGAPLTV